MPKSANLEPARRTIAEVDCGGNLVLHVHIDGAWIGSINNAFTSGAQDQAVAEF